MGKILAAALLSVVCIETIRHDGVDYAPGATINDLPEKQAEQLVSGGHAALVDGSVATAEQADASATTPAAKAPAAKTAAKTAAKKR
jgi:hypothetical protein